VSDEIGTMIRQLNFTRRPESWVAISNGLFFKIPRLSNDCIGDFSNQEGESIARMEFRLANLLADQCDEVLRPLQVERGCLVYEAISGPDMRDALLEGNVVVRDSIRGAICALAELHAKDAGQFPEVEMYGDEHYYVLPDSDIRARIEARKKCLVIDGFEARNFRFDNRTNQWRFFDPHRVRRGIPECDIARFVVSLLMLTWGRSFRFWIWQDFNLEELIEVYEERTGSVVDRQVLRFFLREQTEMRKYFATKSVLSMGWPVKLVAMLYMNVFFSQIFNWTKKHVA
jgi:hypothetical protein